GRALGIMGRRLGLGIILTVNDPTRLGSVTPKDQSQASWIIDTSEQLGYPSCRSIMRLFREKGRGTIAILIRSDPQELRLSRLDEA
ncbi:MAG TPA: hypothetical protein VNB92_03780, partial [Rubrobacter sp.]|nr:hypothetical protein [Rubrobacter sp.]